MRLPKVWGVTDDEVASRYPCDDHMQNPEEAWFRAVTVHADRPTTFRWLCQLRVAPYSYDRIDNRGRRSPRALTPGLERLEIGQRVMRIFELVDFGHNDHMTMLLESPGAVRLFGEIALSYALRDARPSSCRLVVKMLVRNPPGSWGNTRRESLAWGDLLMMRRQLFTLKQLAERGL